MNNNLPFQSHHNCKSNNLPIWSHWQILRPSSFYLQPHNTKDELSLSLNFGNIYWKCVDSLLSLTLLRVTRLECAAVSMWRFKLRNSLTLQLRKSSIFAPLYRNRTRKPTQEFRISGVAEAEFSSFGVPCNTW